MRVAAAARASRSSCSRRSRMSDTLPASSRHRLTSRSRRVAPVPVVFTLGGASDCISSMAARVRSTRRSSGRISSRGRRFGGRVLGRSAVGTDEAATSPPGKWTASLRSCSISRASSPRGGIRGEGADGASRPLPSRGRGRPRARRCARRGVATAVRKAHNLDFCPPSESCRARTTFAASRRGTRNSSPIPQARTHARERSTQEQDGSPRPLSAFCASRSSSAPPVRPRDVPPRRAYRRRSEYLARPFRVPSGAIGDPLPRRSRGSNARRGPRARPLVSAARSRWNGVEGSARIYPGRRGAPRGRARFAHSARPRDREPRDSAPPPTTGSDPRAPSFHPRQSPRMRLYAPGTS